MILKYRSIVLRILNKGTHFSGSLVVEDLSRFLRHSQNKSQMLLPIQRSLELGSLSHFPPSLLLRECARNLAKSPLFPSVHRSCAVFQFSLLELSTHR